MEKKCGKTMKGLPVSERPYEKVLEKGAASLSDAELLSVILRSGTKNIPVREMAEEILNSGNPPGWRDSSMAPWRIIKRSAGSGK